jgi:DNA-binding response OmpR family regulator
LVFEDLVLKPDSYEVLRGERRVDLTQREFELLEYMMLNQRVVISRQQLLEDVWGYDPFADTNTIEVFVSNIRRKLEAEDEARLLHTVRGVGYVLRV